MVLKEVAEAAEVDAKDIYGHDLFLYVRDKGRIFGSNGEFVLSPRLDDLQSAFSIMKGFIEAEPEEYINICAVFDNEEVGSGTRQGADSTFLEDVLVRMCEGLGLSQGEYRRLVAGSFLISADNAHAVHPNHPEKADPTNRPYINGGVVIKYHGGQKYTTDAFSTAVMKSICEEAGVPWQTYTNRSDVAGGSTGQYFHSPCVRSFRRHRSAPAVHAFCSGDSRYQRYTVLYQSSEKVLSGIKE